MPLAPVRQSPRWQRRRRCHCRQRLRWCRESLGEGHTAQNCVPFSARDVNCEALLAAARPRREHARHCICRACIAGCNTFCPPADARGTCKQRNVSNDPAPCTASRRPEETKVGCASRPEALQGILRGASVASRMNFCVAAESRGKVDLVTRRAHRPRIERNNGKLQVRANEERLRRRQC